MLAGQSSLLKLIKEDYRRRQLTAAEVRLEDILGDIEANPVKFTVASSLTDDRQWLHFVAQQGAPRPLRRLVECGADIHGRDAVRLSLTLSHTHSLSLSPPLTNSL